MVLPVIFIILAIFAGGAVGFGIGFLIEKIGGNKVAVLGSRTAGKTTLATFLSTGSIPETYEQTIHGVSKKGRRIELKELKLKISEIHGVPGAREHYRQWKDAFEKSDIVLYLFRTDQLWEGNTETEKRINNDLEHINKWIKENNNDKPYCIVGTHCDLIPGFSEVNPGNQGEFEDKLRALPVMKKLKLLAGNSTFIFGSMKTVERTEILTCYLLRELVK